MAVKPYPKDMRKTFEQVVEETVKNSAYPDGPRGLYGGRPLVGDMFYSSISHRLALHKLDSRFSDFCHALEAAGFWVHS